MDSNKNKIIIADDHPELRFGLKTLINRSSDLSVVDEAADGSELLEKLAVQPCDLVVLDLSMPEMDGLKAVFQIKKKFPAIKILIFSLHQSKDILLSLVMAGIDGFFLKDDSMDHMIGAIQEVLTGGRYFSPGLSHLLTDLD